MRRNVVVLFIDMVGSTELAERLDPELLQQVLDQYYRACATAILSHGGVVEKYIGDAIMAVFGVPASTEDDALKAILAADAARAKVRDLSAALSPTHDISLEIHAGIAAGEVVAVDVPGSDLRVVGDTVNTASRLQGAAGAGEIVVSHDAARLVRGRVTLHELPPLELKGKRDLLRAWQLVSLDGARQDEAKGIELIGRVDEVGQLNQAYERTVRNRQCCLVTVHGVAGIGKTRLVQDFVGALPDNVLVLRSHCPAYGADVTYRPLAEIVEALNGIWEHVSGAIDDDSVRALMSVGMVAGDSETHSGIEEITRAMRTLLEALGQIGPTVVILEDIHWAQRALLELVIDIATWLADVPVLFVCVARPELFDTFPIWGGGISCTTTLDVGPLGDDEMDQYVGTVVATLPTGADVLAHDIDVVSSAIAQNADGNPLFAELMIETMSEVGIDAPIPPTIQAMLAARLDRLDVVERDILERAATIGQRFSVAELSVLASDDVGSIETQVRQLLRHRIIRRGENQATFQFAQTLARDTVYAMTRKELRADWHLALADWYAADVDQQSGGPRSVSDGLSAQYDVAHHLESACRIKREVRPDDPGLAALSTRAAHALIRDGTRALHRRDLPVAVSLLERGRDLLSEGDEEHRMLAIRLSDAAFALGDADRAHAAVDVAEDLVAGDDKSARTCAIQRGILAVRAAAQPPSLRALRELLATDTDDLNWCRFHQLEALVHLDKGRLGAAEAAFRHGVERARALGDRYEEDRLLGGLCELAQWSPMPVADGLALCASLSTRFTDDRALLASVLVTQARLLAMSGDVADAREVLFTAEHLAEDFHLKMAGLAVQQMRGMVESLAGDHEAAATWFRSTASALRSAGHATTAWTLEVYMVRERIRQGQLEEAMRAFDNLPAEESPPLRGRLVHSVVHARLTSLHGRCPEALAMAQQARGQVRMTDDPCLQGDVLFEIAEIYREVGQTADATDAALEALECYLAKGADLLVGRTRDWLATIDRDDQ